MRPVGDVEWPAGFWFQLIPGDIFSRSGDDDRNDGNRLVDVFRYIRSSSPTALVGTVRSLFGHLRRLRRPSPFLWLILSAALFLLGAASFSSHGARELAQFGVFGAVAAIALIVAFLY
jgi:hypothetical protein